MAKSAASPKAESRERTSTPRISKKDQILALFLSGMNEIEDLAMITASRPSYVGSVLQEAGLMKGYFDLYTSTSHPMNVYSKFFANKLGFKDEETAQQSIDLIERLYGQFEFAKDRAGQHHALAMALTMFDRARWTGKAVEAELFRRWLINQLESAELTSDESEEEQELLAAEREEQ
jgi:hypothetical protein